MLDYIMETRPSKEARISSMLMRPDFGCSQFVLNPTHHFLADHAKGQGMGEVCRRVPERPPPTLP